MKRGGSVETESFKTKLPGCVEDGRPRPSVLESETTFERGTAEERPTYFGSRSDSFWQMS